MKQKISWNIPRGDLAVPRALTDAGLAPLLAAVLSSRGFDTVESARDFLAGRESFLDVRLDDLDRAASRIREAVEKREKVAVFGDYDVDGVTATCLMTELLRSLGLDCTPYIPDRISEGYGMNIPAVEKLALSGVTLIVSVDCGITAAAEASRAKELGCDIVITDHHECQSGLPEAAAVVDPKRGGSGHDLAGVGVAFMVACAVTGRPDDMLREYSDLVAVGTVADVMPLDGINRAVVRAGLEKLENDPREGLRALLHEAGADQKRITATSVGFSIAPRLNAAGRMGQTRKALELLLERDGAAAAQLAAELCELNRERQDAEHEIWLEAQSMLRSHPEGRPIVLVGEDWHPGVVGIVASRLSESWGLPSVMICLDGDRGKGSCRSCPGFNIFEALTACSEHLDGFGGHALAAGLTISRENIPAFEEALARYYAENPPSEPPGLDIDLRIDDLSMLSISGVRSLDQLEPCGSGNPRPRMCTVAARLESLCEMGGGRHLRMTVSRGRQRAECVFFSHTGSELGLRAGDVVDIAFYPQVNEFRARCSVQLVLTDIRKHDPRGLCARVLSGGLPEYGEAGLILPEREDFAALWRHIRSRGGTVSGTLDELLIALAPSGLGPGTACAALRVFFEAGLVSLGESGGVITASQIQTVKKADLSEAPFMRALTEQAHRR
ncbi:MAG TPA: single-stranded-DNA-specific exonuclease RecJ [Firmicutes bacterium]|nr:single-stranded-DNA-specific exonuclease RecJ [Bacillota bacterium]